MGIFNREKCYVFVDGEHRYLDVNELLEEFHKLRAEKEKKENELINALRDVASVWVKEREEKVKLQKQIEKLKGLGALKEVHKELDEWKQRAITNERLLHFYEKATGAVLDKLK